MSRVTNPKSLKKEPEPPIVYTQSIRVQNVVGTICASDPKMFNFLTNWNGEKIEFGQYNISVERKITSRTQLIMQKITDEIKYYDVEKIYYLDSTERVSLSVRNKFSGVEKISLDLSDVNMSINTIFDATRDMEDLILGIAEVFGLPIPDTIMLGKQMYYVGLARKNYNTNQKLNEYIFKWKRKNGTETQMGTNI